MNQIARLATPIKGRCAQKQFHIHAARLVAASAAPAQPSPWLTNKPIVKVQKEIYIRHTKSGEGTWAMVWSVRPGLHRIEYSGTQDDSNIRDIAKHVRQRTSNDNGRTWSPYTILPDTVVNHAGVTFWEGSYQKPTYDPKGDVLIQPWSRQMRSDKKIWHVFPYYRLSRDHGATWSSP